MSRESLCAASLQVRELCLIELFNALADLGKAGSSHQP